MDALVFNASDPANFSHYAARLSSYYTSDGRTLALLVLRTIASQSSPTPASDLPDCSIPIEMLQAAVMHAKTGDQRHLLSLPIEQRQLLEEVLPSALKATADEAAIRGDPRQHRHRSMIG